MSLLLGRLAGLYYCSKPLIVREYLKIQDLYVSKMQSLHILNTTVTLLKI